MHISGLSNGHHDGCGRLWKPLLVILQDVAACNEIDVKKWDVYIESITCNIDKLINVTRVGRVIFVGSAEFIENISIINMYVMGYINR